MPPAESRPGNWPVEPDLPLAPVELNAGVTVAEAVLCDQRLHRDGDVVRGTHLGRGVPAAGYDLPVQTERGRFVALLDRHTSPEVVVGVVADAVELSSPHRGESRSHPLRGSCRTSDATLRLQVENVEIAS